MTTIKRKSGVKGAVGSTTAFIPPRGEWWTGFCRSAKEAELAGASPERVANHASHCRGAFLFPKGEIRHCDSPYHEGGSRSIVPRDLDAEIKEARKERALASGKSTVSVDKVTGRRTKESCKYGHGMDETNTGPRGTCRTCKRISSTNFKLRKLGQPEISLTGDGSLPPAVEA